MNTPRRVAALILAAGRSSRAAPANKLLHPDASGVPMIAAVADAVMRSRASPVLAVVGWRAAEIRAALAGRPLRFVEAPDYALGLSASLSAGIRALPAEADAVLVCLGDMPLVATRTLDRLIDAYAPAPGRRIVVPVHAGKQGNPVLWGRAFFAEILSLQGDRGARALLALHEDDICRVVIADDSVLRDFDTREALPRSGEAWTGPHPPR